MTRFFCCFIAEVAEAATTVQNPDPFEGLCEQFKNQAFFSPSNSVNSSLFTKVSIDSWFIFICQWEILYFRKYQFFGLWLQNDSSLVFDLPPRIFFFWAIWFLCYNYSSNFLKGPFKIANFWAWQLKIDFVNMFWRAWANKYFWTKWLIFQIHTVYNACELWHITHLKIMSKWLIKAHYHWGCYQGSSGNAREKIETIPKIF